MTRLLLLMAALALPGLAAAQSNEVLVRETFATAEVTEVVSEEFENEFGIARTVQQVRLLITSGPYEGESIEYENGALEDRADMLLTAGESVVVERLEKPDGTVGFVVREKYRLNAILWLVAAFFAAAVLLGGRTGIMSALGLVVSILILAFFVVPLIIAGKNPLLISVIGAALIACTSLYLAHGFKRRTTVALVSTLITLACSILIAYIFVSAAKLFGLGNEEAVFLQLGPLQQVNLRGLLLGGIIIGALGILDDITTAQTAAIDVISHANPRYDFRQLYQAGLSIGHEHIASLINSLALAYAGASLPLLLLFTTNRDMPMWMILNSEFLAEEIVRTLVGSLTLLIAVPVSTLLAAWRFQTGRERTIIPTAIFIRR